MANVKISALPAVTTVVPGTDVLPLVSNSGATTTKATPNAISAAANAAVVAGSNPALFGAATSANATRFPNAQAVISNTAAGIQQNESHNIGLMAEGVANSSNTNIYGVGVYGAGYTASATRSGGVVGEGHVSASADTGSAIGVRGYANDTHSGGLNIGVYGDATGSSTGNYGFYSNIASGTNNYNLYIPGTGANYFAGSVGIGTTTTTAHALIVNKVVVGSGGYSTGIRSIPASDVSTTTYQMASYVSVPTISASSSFSELIHYWTFQNSFGAGATVTNQYGFQATNALTGATNNYGFHSGIASGTGRWNFYAAGTAANYMAGPLTFTPAASATPANNGNLTFEATSNTSLTIKLKGTDGTVRSVALTLA